MSIESSSDDPRPLSGRIREYTDYRGLSERRSAHSTSAGLSGDNADGAFGLRASAAENAFANQPADQCGNGIESTGVLMGINQIMLDALPGMAPGLLSGKQRSRGLPSGEHLIAERELAVYIRFYRQFCFRQGRSANDHYRA
jgi:hypothetical protein